MSSVNGKLYIKTDGTRSVVEIEGAFEDVLFNWAALTDTITKELHIPPIALAAEMPAILDEYRKKLAGRTEIDLAAMRRQQEGGCQP